MKSVFDSNMTQGNIYSDYANGMQYNTPKADLTWTQALTPEEEKILHKAPSTLSLEIPKEDMLRAKCTHRDPQGKKFTIRRNEDGTYTCLKCGATFNIVDKVDMADIRRIIGGTIDILQTAKLAYIDMTPEAIQTYFIILPFLEIAPKLYEAAVNTLSKVNINGGIGANNVSGDSFNSLYGAVGSAGQFNPAMMQMWAQMMANAGMGMNPGAMNTPMGTMGPVMNNPMQTGNNFQMPGVIDSTAQVQSDNGNKDTVHTSTSFQLN